MVFAYRSRLDRCVEETVVMEGRSPTMCKERLDDARDRGGRVGYVRNAELCKEIR